MLNRVGTVVASLIFGIAMLVAGPSLAGETATVKAFAVWDGNGELFDTGPNEMTFIGALAGTVYVETDQGPVAAGRLVCPAEVTINIEDGAQAGGGRCTITAEDGARIFADVSCAGYHLVGCDGEFKLTGGTERFKGISGGGAVTVRSNFARHAAASSDSIHERASGIMYWPALQYTLP